MPDRPYVTDQETNTPSRKPPAAVIATALCGALLLLLHTLGGFFLLNALLTESEGPWDSDVTSTTRLMAALSVGTELLAGGITAAFISLGRLRRWWYAIPTALVLVAIVRMVFAPAP
ncbi:hypothetical protein IFE09_12395 [Streptomyces microflavus]|nr:hypothetical protein [Streptomyces microflavus]QQZ54334.1 hypothetical protein IFE09_12395 [Streptomyces microflavus]